MGGCRPTGVTGSGQTGVTVRPRAVDGTTASHCLDAVNVRRAS